MIKSLTLENFGQHKYLKINSTGAIIGLLGPNGSGKSTILQALKFAITGDLDDNVQTYIRNFDPESKAVVTMEFIKQGMPGTISRTIGKKNSRVLNWNGEEIKADAKVSALMGDIWGASSKALLFGIFIRQGELDKLLFGRNSEREDLFVKLVGLGHCETVCSKLDAMIAIRKVDMVDYRPLIEQLTQSMLVRRTDLADAEASLAGMPDWAPVLKLRQDLVMALEHKAGTARRVVASENALSDARAQYAQYLTTLGMADIQAVRDIIGQADTKLTDQRKDRELTSARLDNCRRVHTAEIAAKDATTTTAQLTPVLPSAVTEVEARLNGLTVLADALRDFGQNIRSISTDRGMIAQAQTERAQALAELAALKQPEDCDNRIMELQQSLQLLSLSVKLVTERLAAGHVHTDACPACGSKTPDPEFCTRENLTKLEDNRRSIIARTQALTLERDAYLATKRKLENTLEVQTSKILEAEQRIERVLPSAQAVKWDVALAAQTIPGFTWLPGMVGETLTAQATPAALGKLIDDYKQVTLRRDEAQTELRSLTTAQQAYATAEQKRDILVTAATRARADSGIGMDIDILALAREATAQLDGLDRTIAESLEFIKGWRRWEDQLQRGLMAIANAEKNLTNAQGELSADEQGVAVVLAAIELNPLANLWLVDGTGTLLDNEQELIEKSRVRQEQVGTITAIRKALQDDSVKLGDLEQQQQRVDQRAEIVRQLQLMRSIFDRKGLPMMYVKHRFEQLAQLTASNLAAMDADFGVTVYPVESVSFQFARTGSTEAPILPQCKLSGGQRVRLGIAFLLAVQQLICPEVGLLSLDEPSVHLDIPAVENLRDLLESMAARLKNADTQIWVADHHPTLETAFTSIVRLKP